jgi:hypothetical protein
LQYNAKSQHVLCCAFRRPVAELLAAQPAKMEEDA